MKFTDFKLHESIFSGLSDIGFDEPTAIQEKSIPVILEGKDVMGAAQTGTGKTAAFVIPILQRILENPSDSHVTKALILSPTRELAQQIDEQIFALGYHTGISSATIIGGEDFARQANAIRAGVDIIVATPGRLIDQTKVLDIDFSNIQYLVLDEADRMLDMGFLPDVSKIISKLPKKRQTLLYSATLDKSIEKFSSDIMKDPVLVEIELSKPAESVEQKAYHIDGREKLKVTQALLDDLEWSSCIIFTATKRGTDQLERLLSKKGISVASIHGDRNQDERNKALRDFKNGTVPIIVATDVLSRGIDIADVSLIINYDVPKAVDDYIHRVGRTGRYDKTGVAVTLVSKQDKRLFDQIKQSVGNQLSVENGYPTSGKSSAKNEKRSKARKSPKTNNSQKKENKGSEKAKASDKKQQKSTKSEIKPDFSNAKTIEIESKEKGKIIINLKGAEQKDKKSVTVKPKSQKKDKEPPKNRKESPKTTSKKRASARKNPKKSNIRVKKIEKASKRSQRYRKPSKGIWGLIKSFFPKLK